MPRATSAKRTAGDAHGMATFFVRADVATIERIVQAVTTVAGRLDESAGATMDERRVSAVLHLLAGHEGVAEDGRPQTLPSHEQLPTATIVVHTYQGADAPGVARIEGHGPVTEAWLTRVLGPRARIDLQPVIDLDHQAPVDAYEIPERHRRAVRMLTPADTFPFASNSGEAMDIDHTVPYEAGGQSVLGNYGPMTRWHHRIKTFGGWAVQQPFPGIYVWRDPYGRLYLVDHTGTRIIRRPRAVMDLVLAAG